jgi:aspartyl-tRNA(Asn)/glutamyl-tRNA(Gln) amidotransferase subunit C
MIKFTKDDVVHVARLAHLNLTDIEIAKFLPQLAEVVAFVGQLSQVNTDGVEPTSQTTGLENVFRQDKVKTESSLTQEETLSGTEQVLKGCFAVKQVIQKDE